MRIVVDLQGAQSEGSKNRGIGRYSMAITKALIRNRGEHEIVIALNGLFSDTIEPVRTAFDGLLPQENIRLWYAPGPTGFAASDNQWRRQSAELIRETFLASLKPDVIVVSSLFEGLGDNAVTSIGRLACDLPTAVILYDLIPWLNREVYLSDADVEIWYENKLDHLRRADLLLAISESSRQEGIRSLGFADDEVANISTAADPHFEPIKISAENKKQIADRYGVHRPFVMYTGGIDHRKNIEGLIRAYATLPEALRSEHQLAVVCSASVQDQQRLKALATKSGLAQGDLVLTGFVPEADLVALYNLCEVFIFPSWHEGFGLPALEAMACGAPTIGSDRSSIPEVIGRDDALFDPTSDGAISTKLAQVLSDTSFRAELGRHSREQAKRFSWDASASDAIATLERVHEQTRTRRSVAPAPVVRPKLAYVSPLPPERSGIAHYSAELLPELARHYDIDVIVAQDIVSDPWVRANVSVRSVAWFRSHASRYDRVLYHFGNSHFHQHMFRLLEQIPGVVVLHDFFLSGVVHYLESQGIERNCWTRELYREHGYDVVHESRHAEDLNEITWRYPCNLSVLRNAHGIIVHSDNSRRMAEDWYGSGCANDWSVIPLLRAPAIETDRIAARRELGLGDHDYVICSFGILGPTKLNHRLLEAWLASRLATDERSILIFVGDDHHGEYDQAMRKKIKQIGLGKRIQITGWTDQSTFRCYLRAADTAVQLRTLSRGETSAAVLDCMNYGLPTIVNSHGSLTDLHPDAVWKLPDEFTDTELTEALEGLWSDESLRQKLSKQSTNTVRRHHVPRVCATQYYESIERYYHPAPPGTSHLAQAIVALEPADASSDQLAAAANAIAESIPSRFTSRQLLVDISELAVRDAGSGIQRVVRSILRHWLTDPPAGYRVEPVYASVNKGYCYARRFTLRFMNCRDDVLDDEPVEYQPGDMFIGLDLQHHVIAAQRDFLQHMRRHGVQVYFLVYDLLCVLMPQHFESGAFEAHTVWLNVVAESDGAICISNAVADELLDWLDKNRGQKGRPFTVSWFHLGADFEASPLQGAIPEADEMLVKIRDDASFLMVGTVESRKGHTQTLAAFETLWANGVDVNLVIVGKEGWKAESVLEALRSHPELGKRLFWLQGISDEYLENVYAASTCLIAGSEGEGFGLPLIEAAQHQLPIIARDIPVFREVAGELAYYFHGTEPTAVADAVEAWLRLHESNKHPRSDDMPWLTWEQSAEQLKKVILDGENSYVCAGGN